MNLEGLRHFLHLSRTLHFGQTSRECHVSPSTLSRSIQRLERELGAELFARDNRSVELTAAGQRLQAYASQTLSGWEQVQEELRAPQDALSGTLTLFCSVTAAHSFMPKLLSDFRVAHPEVTLKLETGYAMSALEMLETGVVDLTVAALPDKLPRGVLSRVITYTPLLFVAPRAECEVSRMVEQRRVDWSAVPMILPEHGVARAGVERWFHDAGVSPRVYGEVSGNEAALSLISLGCGVGIVPGLVMEKSPLRAQVRALEVRPRLPDFRVGLCVRRESLKRPVVRAFWESISDARSDTNA